MMRKSARRFLRMAVVVIMMVAYAGNSPVYAGITMDKLKAALNSFIQNLETKYKQCEVAKKNALDSQEANFGFGSFSSQDLFLNIVDTAQGVMNGDRFGDKWNNEMEKAFKESLSAAEALTAQKMQERLSRRKAAAKKLREEEAKQKKAEKAVESARESEIEAHSTWWNQPYNWYKSSADDAGNQ